MGQPLRFLEKRRGELGCNPSTKGQLVIKKDNQQTSQQIKEFLDGIGQDFHVTYVDDLASQGVPWGDSLL